MDKIKFEKQIHYFIVRQRKTELEISNTSVNLKEGAKNMHVYVVVVFNFSLSQFSLWENMSEILNKDIRLPQPAGAMFQIRRPFPPLDDNHKGMKLFEET